jgi:hypothetical protein
MNAGHTFVQLSPVDLEIIDYALAHVLEAVERVDNDEESARERSAIHRLKDRLNTAYEKLGP